MVLVQFELTEKANKILEVYMAYTQTKTKGEALNNILSELDLEEVREEYFEFVKEAKK